MMRLNSDLFYEGKLICGTPSHMRRALLSRLPMTNPAIAIAFDTPVTVGTMDNAQGSERLVVTLCATRTSLEKGPEAAFCSDPKRLNVALSRAKNGMFVTGSMTCVQDSATWPAIVA
ncbi:hypothetical protein Aduo_018148 [Ancylostoma duodenale]